MIFDIEVDTTLEPSLLVLVMISIEVETTGVGVGAGALASAASEADVGREAEETFPGWLAADEEAASDAVAAG